MPVSDAEKAVFAKGLKGVVAAETSICDVDGECGLLIYRGYNVDDLAASSSFEEVAYLLLYGELPTPFQLDEFPHGPAAADELAGAGRRVSAAAAAGRLAHGRVGGRRRVREPVRYRGGQRLASAHRKSVRLIARVPTMVAAIGRLRQGEAPGSTQCGPFVGGQFPVDADGSRADGR